MKPFHNFFSIPSKSSLPLSLTFPFLLPPYAITSCCSSISIAKKTDSKWGLSSPLVGSRLVQSLGRNWIQYILGKQQFIWQVQPQDWGGGQWKDGTPISHSNIYAPLQRTQHCQLDRELFHTHNTKVMKITHCQVYTQVILNRLLPLENLTHERQPLSNNLAYSKKSLEKKQSFIA